MARVLLLKPRPDRADGFGPTASPPLGLLYLAAAARDRRPGKDTFLLVDERVEPHDRSDHRRRIEPFNPEVIALSVLTTDAQRLATLARWLAEVAPRSVLIAGGPHVTAYGARVFEQAPIHHAVQGEGEVAFVRLLDALESPDSATAGTTVPQVVPGLLSARPDHRLVAAAALGEPVDVDALPPPAWDLIDFSRYAHHHRMTPTHKTRYAPLFTSRGCPYRCTYCHDVFGKGFRAMSPIKVVDEIEDLIERHQVNDFEIHDDIFNADRRRVLEICREIERRRLSTRFSFPNGIRGDRLDAELIEALASVGTYHMAFAIETASPQRQKMIRKHLQLDRIAANIETAVRAGIFCWGFFMVGFPGETRDEIWKTVRWAARSRLHGAFFFKVMPFAGTPLHAGLGDEAALRDDLLAGGDYHTSSVPLGPVSQRELSRLVAHAYARFYLTPSRIWRALRDYPAPRRYLLGRGLGLARRFMLDRTVRWIMKEDGRSGSAPHPRKKRQTRTERYLEAR